MNVVVVGDMCQVVASQDWPEVTKYAGLVSAQAHRQELIQDLYKTWQDPSRGQVTGGMIKYFSCLVFPTFHFVQDLFGGCLLICYIIPFLCRELLISFRRSTGHKPLRIIFYRFSLFHILFCQLCVSYS